MSDATGPIRCPRTIHVLWARTMKELNAGPGRDRDVAKYLMIAEISGGDAVRLAGPGCRRIAHVDAWTAR